MRCDETRELAPELALGIVDGEERAEALRHLSACADCRRAVEEMTEVADELLMVAPVQEPSAGFESRVVAAMGLGDEPSRRKRARWLSPRWLALRVGPVVATAAVTAAALVGVYHNDHVTAQRYRSALDEAHGRAFEAQRLTDEAGGRAGVAFGYEGAPSWLLVTVDPGHRDSVTRAELTTRDGRTIVLRSLRLDSQGSWGGAIPVKLYDVASVRLLGPHSGDTLRATFPQGSGERN
jgi:Putative zinc-finger